MENKEMGLLRQKMFLINDFMTGVQMMTNMNMQAPTALE